MCLKFNMAHLTSFNCEIPSTYAYRLLHCLIEPSSTANFERKLVAASSPNNKCRERAQKKDEGDI